MISLKKTVEVIKKREERSHMARAANEDAVKLLEDLMEEDCIDQIENWFVLLHRLWNGADYNVPVPKNAPCYSYLCWHNYSYGGCALISNYDIAKHYCTPSMFKKKKEGQLRPNRDREWLDVQADALRMAQDIIYDSLMYLV